MDDLKSEELDSVFRFMEAVALQHADWRCKSNIFNERLRLAFLTYRIEAREYYERERSKRPESAKALDDLLFENYGGANPFAQENQSQKTLKHEAGG